MQRLKNTWGYISTPSLLNKDEQDALFFLNLFEQSVLYVFRIDVPHQEAVTVYAAYGIYHAENIKIM